MKGNMKSLFDLVWNYANSNLGTAVVTSAVTYLLARGAREQELEEAKNEIKSYKETIEVLKNHLHVSDQQMRDLLSGLIKAKVKSESCIRDKAFLRYAYDNSFCFFRHRYQEEASATEETKKKFK